MAVKVTEEMCDVAYHETLWAAQFTLRKQFGVFDVHIVKIITYVYEI